MIDTAALREKVLDLAIRGKLVPQDPNDEPASVLLERIRAQKLQMVKEGKLKAKDIKDDTIIFKGDDNCHYEKFADGMIKNIQEEIPFDLPNGWAWARLGFLASYKKGPFGSSITKSMFIPDCIDAIKVYEQKNAIEKNAEIGHYFISNEKYEELKNFEIFPKDIIVSCAGTIGETFVMPENMRKGIINQALMKISLYDLRIIEFYLIYFDCRLKSLANEQGYGVALKNIPPFDILKKYLVPMPPLEEQYKIIKTQRNIFDLIQLIETDNFELEKIKELVKSKILELAIQGKLVEQDENDEPASVLLERIRAEKKAQLGKKYVESYIYKGDDNCYYENNNENPIETPFILPENWAFSRLFNLAWLEDGEKIKGESLPYLDAKTLRGKQTPAIINEGKIVEEGTNVILVDGENSGEVFEVPYRGYMGSTFKILQTSKHIEKEFIKIILDFNKALFKDNKTGSAIPHLNKKIFKSLVVGLPPINEQKAIISKAKSVIEILKDEV